MQELQANRCQVNNQLQQFAVKFLQATVVTHHLWRATCAPLGASILIPCRDLHQLCSPIGKSLFANAAVNQVLTSSYHDTPFHLEFGWSYNQVAPFEIKDVVLAGMKVN